MRALIVAVLALMVISACDTPPPSLRDASAPFVATSRFDPFRFEGDWYDVAIVAEPHLATSQFVRRYKFIESQNAFVREMFLLRNLRAARQNNETVPGAVTVDFLTGPGKLRPARATQKREWWVLWVDNSYQTAVIAPRSGVSAFILSRRPDRLRAGKLAAARKVLAFNGFDVSQIQDVKR